MPGLAIHLSVCDSHPVMTNDTLGLTRDVLRTNLLAGFAWVAIFVLIILYGSWRPSPLLLLVLFQVGRWALIACSVGTGLYLLVRFIKWAWNND